MLSSDPQLDFCRRSAQINADPISFHFVYFVCFVVIRGSLYYLGKKRSTKHIKHTKHTNEVSVSRSIDQTRRASLVGPHASSCAVIESRVKCLALDLPGYQREDIVAVPCILQTEHATVGAGRARDLPALP